MTDILRKLKHCGVCQIKQYVSVRSLNVVCGSVIVQIRYYYDNLSTHYIESDYHLLTSNHRFQQHHLLY